MSYQGLGAGPGVEPRTLLVMSQARFHNCAIPQCRPGDSNPSSVRLKRPVPVQSGASGMNVSRPGVEPGPST
jgi:hypothetical protein